MQQVSLVSVGALLVECIPKQSTSNVTQGILQSWQPVIVYFAVHPAITELSFLIMKYIFCMQCIIKWKVVRTWNTNHAMTRSIQFAHLFPRKGFSRRRCFSMNKYPFFQLIHKSLHFRVGGSLLDKSTFGMLLFCCKISLR